LDISNLRKGKWYIFTIVKEGGNITWKINETEVLNIQNAWFNDTMNVSASSLVVDDVPGHLLPAGFEIDWVRCYGKSK
jgi:hypothetical protein